jgi:hypothetical protein
MELVSELVSYLKLFLVKQNGQTRSIRECGLAIYLYGGGSTISSHANITTPVTIARSALRLRTETPSRYGGKLPYSFEAGQEANNSP